jgi:hypothetical protein
MKTNTTVTEAAKAAFRYCGGFAALFILSSARLSAQQTSAEEKFSAESKPSLRVTYLQEDGDYLFFKISVEKTGNKRTYIKVTDNTRETFYEDSFSGDSFIKTLKLPKYGDDRIEFEIKSGKETVRKSFEIRSKVRAIYEVSEM